MKRIQFLKPTFLKVRKMVHALLQFSLLRTVKLNKINTNLSYLDRRKVVKYKVKKNNEVFRQFHIHNQKKLQVDSLKVTPRLTKKTITNKKNEGEIVMGKENLNQTIINTLTEIERQDGTLNITAVGCGNAGSRVVDILATKRDSENKPVYTCLAINSNEGDLKALHNIPLENRINLNLGGMGKNPKKGYAILNNDVKVRKQIENFVIEKMNPIIKDDNKKNLIILFAGLGGGTGTSTILKLVEDFLAQNSNLNLKHDLLDAILEMHKLTRETIVNAPADIQTKVVEEVQIAFEKYNVKIGIIAFLPDQHLSDKELEVVQDFASKLWEIAKPKYEDGVLQENQVSFINFPDNQHFSDLFKETLTDAQRKQFGKSRNFANYMVANTIHELNTLPKASSEDTNLDAQDFQTVLLENSGYLSLNKNETLLSNVSNSQDVVEMFMRGFEKGHLHSDLEIISTNNTGSKKQSRIYHTALATVIDEEISENKMFTQLGAGLFVEEAKEAARKKYSIDGRFYEGYIKKPNNGNISVYTLFKTDTLPIRVSRGLSEEIAAAKKELDNVNYSETSSIEVSNNKNTNMDFLTSLLGNSNKTKEEETTTKSINPGLANLLNNDTVPSKPKEDNALTPNEVLLKIANRNKQF